MEDRRKLQEVKHEVGVIRDNIRLAQRLFAEIEKGLEDYKWEALDRETWNDLLYPNLINSPMSPPPLHPYHCNHLFVEQMKFHFKWNHGLLI